jgi:hypothetical protein
MVTGAVLLRLMRSRRRPAVDQKRSEPIETAPPLAVRRREVQFSDFQDVAALKERWGLGKDSWENWRRLWQQNPAMAVARSPLSMGWVLETKRGIVGYQGSVPLLYRLGDRTLIAAAGTSLVVDTAYRARSVGLLAAFYQQPGIELFLITTASPPVGKMLKALRAQPLPQRDYDTVLFWVLDAHQFARAFAMRHGFEGRMATMGTVLGSLVLRTNTLFTPRHRRVTDKFHVAEIQVRDIGDEFQRLWQRKVAEGPRLLADRSPTSLKWHFTIPGSSSTTVVLCCRRFERLVGYAIVRHTIDRETGIRRCLLADILVEDDDSSVTASLLEAAYGNAVASGEHVFEVLGLPGNIRRILRAWNPFFRASPTLPFFYKVADPGLAQTLADENIWYAGPFDGDTTLMP